MSATALDRMGQVVKVGTRVRLIDIEWSLGKDLPTEEIEELKSMVGEVFEVYEIDEYGSAWIEKVWNEPDGTRSHAIGLAAHEMEVV